MRWITWILVAVCVFSYGSPESSNYVLGMMNPAKVWSGEIWRLVTPLFLHGNILHLILNCIVLLQVGGVLEPLIGHSRFLLAFLITGIVSFSCSLLINESIAIGSSGAVFGLIGVLMSQLALLPRQNSHILFLRSLVWFVLINMAFGFSLNLGFSVPIDNVAHIGGFITGLVLGVAFIDDKSKLWLSHIATFITFAILISSVTVAIRPTFKPSYQYWLMTQNSDLDKLITGAHDHPLLWEQFWSDHINQNLCEIVITSYSDKIDAMVWNNCAWLLLKSGNEKEKSLAWAQKAMTISKGKEAGILDTLAEAYEQNGNLEESKAIRQRAALLNAQPKKRP